MYALLTRLQGIAYVAVRDKEVHVLIAAISGILVIAAALLTLLIFNEPSRRVLLVVAAIVLLVWLWIRLCGWVVRRMAHTYDAKLRIMKAADYQP